MNRLRLSALVFAFLSAFSVLGCSGKEMPPTAEEYYLHHDRVSANDEVYSKLFRHFMSETLVNGRLPADMLPPLGISMWAKDGTNTVLSLKATEDVQRFSAGIKWNDNGSINEDAGLIGVDIVFADGSSFAAKRLTFLISIVDETGAERHTSFESLEWEIRVAGAEKPQTLWLRPANEPGRFVVCQQGYGDSEVATLEQVQRADADFRRMIDRILTMQLR